MSKSERHYCVTRKESLAVTRFVMYFKHYLFGIHFLVMMNSDADTVKKNQKDSLHTGSMYRQHTTSESNIVQEGHIQILMP